MVHAIESLVIPPTDSKFCITSIRWIRVQLAYCMDQMFICTWSTTRHYTALCIIGFVAAEQMHWNPQGIHWNIRASPLRFSLPLLSWRLSLRNSIDGFCNEISCSFITMQQLCDEKYYHVVHDSWRIPQFEPNEWERQAEYQQSA